MNPHQKATFDVFSVRQRRSWLQVLYGDHAATMIQGTKHFDRVRDRAAYVFITGSFPSPLRKEYTEVLRSASEERDVPTSLDGRVGSVLLRPEVTAHLALDQHPMVSEVRNRIAQGYWIQPSRGEGTVRSYDRIFMFRLYTASLIGGFITIKVDGAIKQGWG